MVMVPMQKCFICNQYKSSTYSIYIKNYLRFRNYGYQFCKKCECLADIFLDLYEESGKYIPNYKFNKKLLKKIKFFRVSSNPSIKPCIETGWINILEFPVLSLENNKYHKRIPVINICWGQDPKNYTYKIIPLANIICYNREIFGYSKEEGILKVCVSFWNIYIKEAYEIANIPFEFFKSIDHNPHWFDNLIRTKIINYWRSDLVF